MEAGVDSENINSADAPELCAPHIEPARYLREAYGLSRADIRTISPLTLAYIGDAVYDLWVRSYVVMSHSTSPEKLHNEVTRYVSAVAQSRITQAICDRLTDEEADMLRRGRNAKPHSMAKNATAREYHNATGLECLVGYLFLSDDIDRLTELIKIGIEEVRDEK